MSPDQLVPWHVGLILERAAEKGFLEGAPELGYRRTELGLLALGVAGKQLKATTENGNIPIKNLTGEESQKLHRHGTSVTDAIEKRLGVWCVLLEKDPSDWFPIKEVLEELGQLEFGEAATRGTLEQLSSLDILEKRIGRRGIRNHPAIEYRWGQNERRRYIPAVKQYLRTVQALLEFDLEYIASGIGDFVATYEFIKQKGLVAELIRQAQETTPRHSLSANS
jgi:hypothetical protein